MLDQVIYTRCTPHRDLLRNGAVVRADGYDVFSMSQTIFDPSKKIDFTSLKRSLAPKNASKENDPMGLFNSYEYSEIGAGVSTMIFEVPRELCQIPRKNGKGHRAGNFIKQALIGSLKGYPCDFFGASCWTAHQKSENDYYLDEPPTAEPEWLPQVSAAPKGGYITRERIRAFVRDGREETVKKALWFLLQEFEKPISDRKVLLIKDLPSNVELWVAAISYAFSAEMAQQITFTTNKTNLNGRADMTLFYYTDNAGKFYPMRNASVPMTRRPYCMIVGYHPQDKNCSTVRQTTASNFVILDGAAKMLDVDPNGATEELYYKAAVQYDDDIGDFCSVLLPSLPLDKISIELPALFDAYKYLLDSNHKAEKWAYNDALLYLKQLTKFGLPSNDALNQYLLNACISAYTRFASQDEQNKYPFLKIMWKIAVNLKREQEVTDSLADCLTQALCDLPGRGDQLSRSWRAIADGGIVHMVQPALQDMFSDNELQRYNAQIGSCIPATLSTVMDMYLMVLGNAPGGVSSIMNNSVRQQFVCNALTRMAADRRAVIAVLQKFKHYTPVLHAVSVAVSENLSKVQPGMVNTWWDTISGITGGDLVELCRVLLTAAKVKIALVEQLLARSVRHNRRCTADTLRVFEDAIRKLGSTGAGETFFEAWIDVATVEDVSQIVSAARRLTLTAKAKKAIFQMLDERLDEDITNKKYMHHARAVSDWADELGLKSRTLTFAEFRSNMERAKVHEAIVYARDFAKNGYEINYQFLMSDQFADLVDSASRLEDPELTLKMLKLFKFDEQDAYDKFVETYVETSLKLSRGAALIRQMAMLTEAAFMKPQRGERDNAQITLEDTLKRVLPQHARPDMINRIDRLDDYSEDTKDALLRMLKCTPGGGFGGFFSGFGMQGGLGGRRGQGEQGRFGGGIFGSWRNGSDKK